MNRGTVGLTRRVQDAVASLKFKATSLVAVLTFAVAAVVSGYLLETSGQFARNQHDTHMVQVVAMLAKAAATMMEEGERVSLQSLAEESANGKPLLYVIISNVDGRQLAVAEHKDAGVLQRLHRDSSERVPVPGRPEFRVGTEEIPVFLDVSYPVAVHEDPDDVERASPGTSATRLLGYVRAGMITSGWTRTMANRLDLLVGFGILAAVAAIPLGFLLIRRIVSPLDGLAHAMFRFSQGDLDVRSPAHRHDEIGRLQLAFNRMADQHQYTHERIVRLNAELEKRVAQRTLQLRELASRDPLTSLYNRRYFNEVLERCFSEALRYETELSCIMIDLDGFKNVNDDFGHPVGDELLVLTAATISSQLRGADVAARFGGDEFIVLLPQTDADQGRVSAERIVERFNADVSERISQVRITMSLGIASLAAPDIQDAESLIRTADHALYEAKAAGRNRIVTAVSAARPAPL